MSRVNGDSLLALILVVGACACSDEPQADPTPIAEPEDPPMILRTEDLVIAVETLSGAGCIEDPAALRSPLSSRDLEGLRRALETSAGGICSGGMELMVAMLDGPGAPLFERGRVVFDGTLDGCAERVLDLETFEVDVLDADEDGCMDRIWEVGGTTWYRDLSSEAQAEIDGPLTDLLLLLFPPHLADGASSREEEMLWRDDRAGAPQLLDALLASIEASELIPAPAKTGLGRFLENARSFVGEYLGCFSGSSSSEESEDVPRPCETPEACAAEDFQFYVYTDGGHAWKSLTIRGTDHARGLYPTFLRGAAPLIPQPGRIVDETSRRWTHRICWDISADEAQTIKDSINHDITYPPTYGYFDGIYGYLSIVYGALGPKNCMGWAASNAAKIGKRLPPHTTLGVPDPETLQESLEELMKNGKTAGADRIESNPN